MSSTSNEIIRRKQTNPQHQLHPIHPIQYLSNNYISSCQNLKSIPVWLFTQKYSLRMMAWWGDSIPLLFWQSYLEIMPVTNIIFPNYVCCHMICVRCICYSYRIPVLANVCWVLYGYVSPELRMNKCNGCAFYYFQCDFKFIKLLYYCCMRKLRYGVHHFSVSHNISKASQ